MFDLPLIKNKTSLATLDFQEETASTNDRAIELIRSGKLTASEIPTLVLTAKQTAGRGQRSHKWWSGEGSLTFTYIQSADDISPLASLAVAVSIAEAIEAQSPLRNLKIKWPNDILCDGRKLCGILIETTAFQDQRFMIIGIGINANNESVSTEELKTLDQESKHAIQPTSIRIESGQPTNLNALLIDLIARLDNLNNDKEVVERANERLAFRDEQVRVAQPSQPEFIAKCNSIDGKGHLVVTVDGESRLIASATIRPL